MYLGNHGLFFAGSQPPYNYGEKSPRGEVKLMIDTIKGEISYRVNGNDYGVAAKSELMKQSLFLALSCNE